MWFLATTLTLVTLLLCYAGYVFLIVDRREEAAVLEDPELYEALDDKNYNFELPEQVDTYEDLRLEEPTDKRALPLALLERAKADIPRIEQLEKDHPRMARLFQKGLLPFGVWEQLLEAEAMMDTEVNSVQAEAERLQKGWGQGVFSQAYQMLRQDRTEQQRAEQAAKDAAVLTLTFTKPSGGVVKLTADGIKVTQQTPLKLRKESAEEEISYKCEVTGEMKLGAGDEQRTYEAINPDLVLDANVERQWKQIGSDPTGLRLQVRFVKRTKGNHTAFQVMDVRATVPDAPSSGDATSEKSAGAGAAAAMAGSS